LWAEIAPHVQPFDREGIKKAIYAAMVKFQDQLDKDWPEASPIFGRMIQPLVIRILCQIEALDGKNAASTKVCGSCGKVIERQPLDTGIGCVCLKPLCDTCGGSGKHCTFPGGIKNFERCAVENGCQLCKYVEPCPDCKPVKKYHRTEGGMHVDERSGEERRKKYGHLKHQQHKDKQAATLYLTDHYGKDVWLPDRRENDRRKNVDG